MVDHQDDLRDADGARYRQVDEIEASELSGALWGLALLGDDAFLRMQALNLAIIDQFALAREDEVLRLLRASDATPLPEAAFLSALSQMWIFAAYELLRTWRQRVRETLKLVESGELRRQLSAHQVNQGYQHFGRQIRALQIGRILNGKVSIDAVRRDYKRVHILYARLEALRISLAKHEVRGRARSVALMPGYGRINSWCGALDFELENGYYSMGTMSRRDVADEIRRLGAAEDPPSDEQIREFDAFMRGQDP